MLKLVPLMVIIAGVWCGLFVAHAQRETEIYIPIGKSPGVSGKMSVIGKIETYNAQTRTVKISAGAETNVPKLTAETRIWLDRSKLGKPNTTGTVENCQPGLRCEVKYRYQGDRRLEEAEWIKVEVTGD
jgi:hypothetical protein